jgi:hypothetical protein
MKQAKNWIYFWRVLAICNHCAVGWFPMSFILCLDGRGISSSKLCFCTGEIACYSTFDGEKMRKLLLHHFFFLSLHHLPVSSQKSLYRSPSGRHFNGTENVIWVGFEPIGNLKKMVRLWATFEDSFFIFPREKASALKNCILSLLRKRKIIFFCPWKHEKTALKSIVYCSIGDTSLRDFYMMTLFLSLAYYRQSKTT